MKVFLLLFIATVYTAVLANQEFPPNTHVYPRYIQYSNEDGTTHTIDLQDQLDTALLNEINRNPANNRYFLYTRQNPTTPQELIMNNANTIRYSNFNRNHPTVVIVHGWLNNQNSDLNPVIRDAYLGQGQTNVIVVDWRRLAISNYVTAANGVPALGWGLGQFLQFLTTTTGAYLNSIHIVGFSLGAHLAGNAGRALDGKVARVTGLDPAGPLWNLNRDRLNPNDAIYVEAIHTDGGYTVGGLGIGSNVGNADFYPNGGISQPGCISNVCNHNRVWKVFAATVSYNHLIANQCSNSMQLTLGTCRGRELPMGNGDLRKSGTGVYRVDTRRRYPY